MPEITLRTSIKADKRKVFDLSRSIDLHKISTAHTKEEAIGGITTGLIGLNESVTWRAKHFGLYFTLTSKITNYKYPDQFTDVMVKGIFKRFRHEHHFHTIADETLMIDIFDYEAPYGVLGKLANMIFLKKYMKQLLLKRNYIIKEFAESDKWRELILP